MFNIRLTYGLLVFPYFKRQACYSISIIELNSSNVVCEELKEATYTQIGTQRILLLSKKAVVV